MKYVSNVLVPASARAPVKLYVNFLAPRKAPMTIVVDASTLMLV